MKKKFKRVMGITMSMALMFGSVSAVSAAYAPGVYEGSGQGFKSTIKASVKIEDGKIAAIDILESNDTASFWNRAHPEMENRIIAAQSTDVDVVSGATYSSNGIIAAVKDALSKAGVKEVDKSKLQALVTEAGKKEESKYTASSWAVFADALKEAKAVLDNQDAAQETVDTALSSLQGAMDQLVLKNEEPAPGKEGLQALIAYVEGLDESTYTRTTWSALANPLNTAKQVNGKADATEEEISSAVTALQAAVDALVIYVPGDKHVSTLEDLKAYAPDMREGETLYIDADIDAVSSATINTYTNFTLDGQGHTLNGNNAHGFVYVRGGDLTIKNTVFKDAVQYGRGGTPIAGAAVYARRGGAVMENCAVIGNESRQGAVYVANGQKLSVTNCTFVDNKATNTGASIYAADGSTVLLANNIAVGGSADDVFLGASAALTDGGYNRIGTYSGPDSLDSTTTVKESYNNYSNWMSADGMLTGAAKNPALNQIPADNAYLPDTDLRGLARPQEGKGDIGCYEAEPVAIESMSISNGALVTVSVKKTVKMKVDIFPANATMRNVTWTSKNPAVADINGKGVVTPKKSGTTVIVATAENGVTCEAVVRVTK